MTIKTLYTYYLSLGSNIGNKVQNLQVAISYIEKLNGIEIKDISHYYKSSAWGFDGDDFVNNAITIVTAFEPENIFYLTQEIQKKMGRKPSSNNKKNIYTSRIIDIDIILWENNLSKEFLQFNTEKIQIPHLKFLERNFVLLPLKDIIDPSQSTYPIDKAIISNNQEVYKIPV